MGRHLVRTRNHARACSCRRVVWLEQCKTSGCGRKGRIHPDRAYHLGNYIVRSALSLCVTETKGENKRQPQTRLFFCVPFDKFVYVRTRLKLEEKSAIIVT